MKLEEQVVSLELAKKLKELGVKQESEFVWMKILKPHEHWELCESDRPCVNLKEDIRAFTVAELGEMLPRRIQIGEAVYWFQSGMNADEFWCEYHNVTEIDEGFPLFEPITEVKESDSRAKMLIHLIEKGMVKP